MFGLPNGDWSDSFACGLPEPKYVITVVYADRYRLIKLNGKILPDFVFDDTESFIKDVMELARKYPDAEIVEVEE